MVPQEEGSVHAFIDATNLHLGIKHQGWLLDYAKFKTYLKDKYKVQKIMLFMGYLAENQMLYDNLQKLGYILVFKPSLLYRSQGKLLMKGNADAELVLHCCRGLYLNEFDTALIVTGDGDFYCLVEELVKYHKLKRLLIPSKSRYSRLLQRFTQSTDFMDSLRRKIGK